MDNTIKEKWLDIINKTISQGPFSDSWDSLEHYSTPDWYQDAKFGIFIHWGIYSVPGFGSEWYSRAMYVENNVAFEHHRSTYGLQSEFGYKDFIPMFKAEKFDPAAWAELFQKSGAKYVMPVAEHHDGFQMYDSELSRWNSAQMGPHRDIVGELANEVRERGMVFTVSSHRAEHWWFMDGGRAFDSDVNDPEYQDFYGPAMPAPGLPHQIENYLTSCPDQSFLEDWLIRTCELIDKYRPQILWFDWWIQNMAFKPYLKKLAAFYYNRGAEWGLGVSINYKFDAFPVGTAVYDVERGQLTWPRALFWQTDTSVGLKSWGYTKNNSFKKAGDIVCDLVDIVSKNGSLLLNVGPAPDGTIVPEEAAVLLEIGDWLRVNGEAIYGTRPWVFFGEGPTKIAEGAFTDTARDQFTSEDIRYTAKDGAIYAFVMRWPENGTVRFTRFKTSVMGKQPYYVMPKTVTVLGSDVTPEVGLDDNGLWVKAPGIAGGDFPVAVKIVL